MRERTDRSSARRRISRPLVVLLAVACGAAVANLYYAQPLLHTIAGAFAVSNSSAGLLVTVTQAGYVLGLALLVPLGDLLERRRLIAVTLVIAAAGLGLAAAPPGFAVFALAVAALGLTAVVAQIIVAMSSSLAAEHERGRVVGTVMSGLLIGILAARTISGIVAQLLGWRVIYVIAGVWMLLLAGMLAARSSACPRPSGCPTRACSPPSSTRPPRAAAPPADDLGATAFGCFSVLWTSVAFLFSGAPYHYGNAVIGLFGLAGLAGALAAPVAGRLSDRGRGRVAMSGAIVLLLLSWGVLAFGRTRWRR